MSDSLHSPSPVDRAGGFAGRAPNRQPADKPNHRPTHGHGAEPAADAVELSAAPVRRLLRERVLACTREALGVQAAPHPTGPVFAEAVDSEPLSTFLGRLLSAQHQLAVQVHQTDRVVLAGAFAAGAAETIELLGESSFATVEAALAGYAERTGVAVARG